MELNDFKSLKVFDTVYVKPVDVNVTILGFDYTKNRILSNTGMIYEYTDIEKPNYKQVCRLTVGADIGVLEVKINNLIDEGNPESMEMIHQLLMIKKEKEKELINLN